MRGSHPELQPNNPKTVQDPVTAAITEPCRVLGWVAGYAQLRVSCRGLEGQGFGKVVMRSGMEAVSRLSGLGFQDECRLLFGRV